MTDAPPRADECVGLVHLLTKRYGLVFAGLLIIALLVLAAPAGAADIPIDTSYPGGIAAAVTNAGSGGSVILAPGTYNQYDIPVGNSVTIRANASLGGERSNTIINARYNGPDLHRLGQLIACHRQPDAPERGGTGLFLWRCHLIPVAT